MYFQKSPHILKSIVHCLNNPKLKYQILNQQNNIIGIRLLSYLHNHQLEKDLQKKDHVYYYHQQNQKEKFFHTDASKLGKVFFDKENQYAHNILETLDNYKLYTNCNFIEQQQQYQKLVIEKLEHTNIDDILENCSNLEDNSQKLYENFIKIVNYCNQNEICISNDKFDKFIDIFINNCYKFNDEQLIHSIHLLSLLPVTLSPFTRNYLELWNSLDDNCLKRIDNWSIDQILLISDCWYLLNLTKSSNFVWQGLRKISRKIRKLNSKQLVQTMFICNLIRKPLIEMFDFELNFYECINELTINEIGIMSMGFFKTQTPIRNPKLINEIYNRLMQNLDSIENITLVNILKILRYSSKLPQCDLMYELLDKLCNQIERLSLLSCLHIALLGVEIQLCHDKCIKLIIERFNRDINESRIKDMERICHVISLFNIKTENNIENELCKNIINEIKNDKRIDEITKYPKSFSSCIYYLILCNNYDKELISCVLDQKFIKYCYGNNFMLGREIFLLDSFIRINLQNDEYNGNLLTDKQRKTMGKCLTNYIPEKNSKYKLNVTDRILLEIKDTCYQLLQSNCYFKHILPHFERPDILFCYDKLQHKTIPLKIENFPDYKGIILSRNIILDNELNQPNIESVAVIVAGWNNFVRDKDRITGLFQLKLKQLEILGYRTIVVSTKLKK